MKETHHITPPRVYVVIFVVLLVLLWATVQAAYLNLGPAKPVVAVGIAIVKALLVLVYFMHLQHASALTRVFAAVAFFWLLLLFGGSLHDYITRH
jgi:cytochrome c oxidase subunit 4